MKKRWLVESAKNFTIMFLTCSAFYLAFQVDAFTNFSSFLQEENENVSQSTVTGNLEEKGSVRPVSMMATAEVGGVQKQFGVQYSLTEGDVFFSGTTQLLKEALGNVGDVVSVTEETFLTGMTTAPSLYFELFGQIPLDFLEKWLSQTDVSVLSGEVSRFGLGVYEEEGMEACVALFYEENGRYYVAPVSLIDQARLSAVLGQLEGEELSFAFQQEGLEGLYPMTLLGAQPKETVVLTGSTPFDQTEQVERFLTLLDFHSSQSAQYHANDGIVVRGTSDSLRLSYDGVVTYDGEEGSRYQLPRVGGTISLLEQVEGCGQFIRSLFEGLDKTPEVSLFSVEEGEEMTVISFYYSLNGIPVVWNEDVVSAEFHLKGDVISRFTLHYRNYTETEQKNPTLPLVQTQAILQGLGAVKKEIFFAYQDLGRESVSAGWVVR